MMQCGGMVPLVSFFKGHWVVYAEVRAVLRVNILPYMNKQILLVNRKRNQNRMVSFGITILSECLLLLLPGPKAISEKFFYVTS